MKILHILPSIRIGGVLSVVYNLAVSQRKQGYEVGLYISRPEIKYRDKEPMFLNIGCELNYSQYSNIYDPRHIGEIRKLMRKYDIVHVHLFPHQLWANIAHRLLPRKNKPVLITTEHNTYNNRRKYSFLRIFDKFLYSPYNKIVSISGQTKHNLDNWLKIESLKERDIVITNGINIDLYKDAQKANLTDLNIPIDAKIVIMVSRLSHPKDPLTLVKALNLCENNIHLLLVGEGSIVREIKTLIKELKLEQRIHLLGLRDDVPALLKVSDIGVLSTNWDGFGLVAVEYMAAGLPVLVSDVDGLRDVVGEKECLFEVGDYRSLASKITNLLNDQCKYNELKKYSEKRCLEFSIDKTNDAYNNLYRSLMK